MNYRKISLCCLTIFLSISSLFAGKITIYNDTEDTIKVAFRTYQNNPVRGSLAWSKVDMGGAELTIAPHTNESYEAKAVSKQQFLGTHLTDYYGLNDFNFSIVNGTQKFVVKGAVGETFSDYSKIDVGEGITWQLWLKPA